MRRRRCCRLRVGCNSLDNAANLLGITRTAQGLLFAGYRSTSGGVLLSLPGQNGQLSTNSDIGCTTRCVARSSGRLARSVAMMTHSLVKKFWRSSGMYPSSFSYRQMERFLQSAGGRKWSSFRYLQTQSLALKTDVVIPTPERMRGAEESASPNCYRIPSILIVTI